MPQVAAIRTKTEIAEAISALVNTRAGMERLILVARTYHARRAGKFGDTFGDERDLLHEAIQRASDSRNCPVDIDVIQFLDGIMSSIVDFRQIRKACHVDNIDDHEQSEDVNRSVLNPEQAAAARIALQRIPTHFDDDPKVRAVVEGRLQGLDPLDLSELFGNDNTAYATACRKIRRRLAAKYPGGWKP